MAINNSTIDGIVEMNPWITTWDGQPHFLHIVLRHLSTGHDAVRKEGRSGLFLAVINAADSPAKSLMEANLDKADYIVVNGQNKGTTEITLDGRVHHLSTIRIEHWSHGQQKEKRNQAES